jgi:hypothetical protein
MVSSSDSWAKFVPGPDAVPPIFQVDFRQDGKFPYTIYHPVNDIGHQRTNAKLICLYEDKLTIIENIDEKKTDIITFQLKDTDYLTQGRILLSSWISIFFTVDQTPKSTTILFNTAVDTLFTPIVLALRQAMTANVITNTSGKGAERSELDDLRDANFKFFSYASTVLLQKQSVLQSVYQPAIEDPLLAVFRNLHTPDHLVILTDSEFILMEDADSTRKMPQGSPPYGIICSYLPLQGIRHVDVRAVDGAQLISFSLTLPHDEIHLPFAKRQEPDLIRLKARLEEAVRARS